MLIVTKGAISRVVMTLTEKEVGGTHYLMLFTSRATNETVALVLAKSSDASTHTDRYNDLSIPAATFAGKTEGIWKYQVYEQSSSSNTDPAGLTLLETGFIKLVAPAAAADTYSDGNLTYTVYNG